MSKKECIELIRSCSDKYGDKLLDLMEKFDVLSLSEITEEQANEYVDIMIKRRNKYEKMAYSGYSRI